ERLTACVAQVARGRDDVTAQNGELRFRDPAQDLRFRGLVSRAANMIKAGPWKSALTAIAEGAAAAPPFASLPGIIPSGAYGQRWECPRHAADQKSWVDTSAGKEIAVSANRPQLMCPEHPDVPIQDEMGRPITIETLGAARLRSASGAELIVWKDV